MPVVSTAMYEVISASGRVGTIATVRPVVSDGASATTIILRRGELAHDARDAAARTGQRHFEHAHRLPPGTSVVASIGTLNVVDHGAVVLNPSSAFIATFGSLKSVGSATGILSVRSVVPSSSRLFGNGTTPFAGSNEATGWNGTGAV